MTAQSLSPSHISRSLSYFHQQDDILLEVLEIALLALLVPNFSQLELVTYLVIDSLVLDLELEKN
jgi:hypothetical protein